MQFVSSNEQNLCFNERVKSSLEYERDIELIRFKIWQADNVKKRDEIHEVNLKKAAMEFQKRSAMKNEDLI